MFEFLFNYPLSTWQRADIVWSSGWPVQALFVCLALAFVLIAITLTRQQISASKRIGLGMLQLLSVACVLTMLWQPGLRIELMQAGENTVAYLLDTSKSMHIQDSGQLTRLQDAHEILESDALVGNALFDASVYSVGNDLQTQSLPVDIKTLSLANAGTRSAIADSLLSVLDSVSDQALAAVVVLSDGADNTGDTSSQWWQAIKAAGVPVHTVGFGQTIVQNDIELSDVHMDDQAGVNTSVTARLRIVHNGIDSARLRVSSGDQLLHAETLTLDASQAESVHAVTFNSGPAGIKDLQFSITSTGAENNTANNVQQRVLTVADQPKRVLYVEGQPRWEYKFIRRALHNFSGVEVVSLLRTSPNKFYRQGVHSATELANGFPATRESLFAYDAIIIGSLDAAELNAEQQANLRDFVSKRGGSLLMLAGQHGLGDGGWGRSALAAALPATLSSSRNAKDFERRRAVVQPTTQGLRTAWMQLDEDDALNMQTWSNLPAINDVQSVGIVKPGSTTLLAAKLDSQVQPLLVWHRYGQGMSFILGTSGTWRWQMSLPSEDQSHETFWQQFLTHMVTGALPQLSLDNAKAVYRDLEEIPIALTARRSDFEAFNEGELQVRVTSPSGVEQPVQLTADIDQPGRFVGSIVATEDGPYAVSASLPVSGEAQAAATGQDIQRWLIKESNTAEQFDTGLHREFLQRVSAATGGRYLDAADKDQLAQVLSMQNVGITREELLPLWNMPALFLLLLLAKALEWFLRLKWMRL